jgi:signal transduction histidine kinase/ligand-binding sensor domain-containing protein
MPKIGSILAFAWLAFGALMPRASAAANLPSAAVAYAIDHWDTEQGLPNNEVTAIAQTRDGYLWLGTLNGLVRFDGLNFTVFDESNTPGLTSGRILRLFEDSHGNLWIGTEGSGILVMRDGQVTSAPEEFARGGADRTLSAICEEPGGEALWFALANGDFWRYSSRERPQPFVQSSSLHSAYRGLIAERNGPIWVGTDFRQSAIGPLSTEIELPVSQDLRETKKLDLLLASRSGGYWRLAGGRIQKWNTNHLDRDWGPYPWSLQTRVSCGCEDGEENLLIGTLGQGVFRLDSPGKSTVISTNDGLSNNYILSLQPDREGSLWVGTDGGGLNRVRHQVFHTLKDSQRLTVRSVCEARNGGLWLGFNAVESGANGAGFWKDGVMKWFGPRQGLINPSVWSVFEDEAATLWAGTARGLFSKQAPNDLFQSATNLEVFAIHQDRHKQVWLGLRGAVACRNTAMSTVLGSPVEVHAIADDADGNLWIGTRGGGLGRLRDGKLSFLHKSDGLPSEEISSLYVDEQGVLWVGTLGNGLGRLEHGKWAHLTKREGLLSNSIGYLLEDGQGYMWIGSNAGLMRAPKKALNDFARGATDFIQFRGYGTADGLPTAECTLGSQPGACRARDGTLWFPTIKGLAWIDPAQLRPNTNPPPVAIESVLIEGQEQNTNGLRTSWREPLSIPPGKERIEIRYTSLNLAAADRSRFKYRLEGHEKAWTDAGNIRVAHYTKLPPGQYRFRVTACNEDGVWNETGSVLALNIEPPPPPLWRRWWFLAATTAGILGTVVAVVHYVSTQKLQRQLEMLRQQEALEKERSRIARDIHDQLGASLTQVSLLGEFVESDKDSPAEVEAHARQICQTARDTTRVLDEIVWTVNPSNDTLDGLITYICKYAQDYLSVAGLRYRLEAPPELPAANIAPELRHNVFLAAKEAVTNVVRHAKASSVWLRLKLEPHSFTLEIQDDGRGLAGLDSKAAQLRNGLRNMRKRMEDIGGNFTMEPAPEGGTIVRLTGPLKVD